MYHKINALLLLILMFCVCGCGTSGPERVVVSGTVKYQGKPIERGTIRFVPAGDSGGSSTGAAIIQGHFEASAKGGVLVGTHRVEIIATVPHRDAMGTDTAAMEEVKLQQLPEKYNRRSTLSVKIEPGVSAVHDFDLQ